MQATYTSTKFKCTTASAAAARTAAAVAEVAHIYTHALVHSVAVHFVGALLSHCRCYLTVCACVRVYLCDGCTTGVFVCVYDDDDDSSLAMMAKATQAAQAVAVAAAATSSSSSSLSYNHQKIVALALKE